MADIIFITGPTRSGKSRRAVEIAQSWGEDVVFVATYRAEPNDAEMVERIRLHRGERKLSWRTLEAPADVIHALAELKPKPSGAVVDRCLLAMGIPELAAAALALGAGAALTGALHEDGLADVGDGFGGGRDREQKLAIMRDSRLGTYGALVLMTGFVARLAALASLPTAAIIPALVVAHALARTAIPPLATMMPIARDDGLGK